MKDNQMKQAEFEEFRKYFNATFIDKNATHLEVAYEFFNRGKLTTSQVSEPACSICNDSGYYCTGYSGLECDGNAPMLERCDCEIGQPTTTPQEAISPAIAEYVKALEMSLEFTSKIYKETCEKFRIEPLGMENPYKQILASKPTGLE